LLYLSIKHRKRQAAVGNEPSVGSGGDCYTGALAETINGPFKAAIGHRRRPWRSFDIVKYATLEFVDCFNNRRRPEPTGSIPAAEPEAIYYSALETDAMAA